MVGKNLSHYKILEELGRGGMGIVYKAEDTKLDRTVALKVLPAAALASEDDRARFYREAKAAAQLHHPNIATVFEIEEAILIDEEGNEVAASDGPRPFIAMEFIEGDTLQEHIKKAPLKLQEAVNIGGQIAEALKAAHEKEIVHRDIKSANVMLTKEGVAKVLDFGLAKTNQSTMLTRMGSTLGTVAYMSPEQARGQEVDGRSDLYSLGTVLYEMVAGRLPFEGEYEQAVLYSILNETPESLTALRAGVPMQLDWLVNKLLSKEAEYRYQTAADLLADLKSLDLSGSGQSRRSMAAMSADELPVAESSRSGVPKWIWPAMVGIAVVAVGVGWIMKPQPIEDRDTAIRNFTLELPGFSPVYSPAASLDGRLLSFAGTDSSGYRGAFVLDLETNEIKKVPGAEESFIPLFSPDASRLLIRNTAGYSTIPVSGGTAHRLDEDARDAAWMSDGSILYRKANVLWLLPATGEQDRKITSLDSTEAVHGLPSELPGGRHIIFHVQSDTESLRRLEILDLQTGSRSDLGFGSHPKYLKSGHLLYGDGSSSNAGPLMLRPFDIKTLRFTGPEVTLHQNAPIWLFGIGGYGTWYDMLSDASGSLSETVSLFEIDAEGQNPNTIYSGDIEHPRLSPDDTRVALSVENGEEDYLMILNLTTGVEQRITFNEDVDHYAWAEDGERIMLVRAGKVEIWSAHGLGQEETLPINTASFIDWSSNGRYVVYVNDLLDRGPLHLFDMDTGVDTLFESNQSSRPRFSPDGRFVTYVSFDSDGIRSFVRATTGSGFARLSIDEPEYRRPVWSRDAKSILVDAIPDHIVRIPVDISDSFVQTGRGETILSMNANFEFDITDDGRLFVLSSGEFGSRRRDPSLQRSVKLNVIVNWFEHIKQLAPSTIDD